MPLPDIQPGKKPVVVLIGPTAVGKTDSAIALAVQLGGEIISADSRLFYRGMDIGTGKPTAYQRTLVPHHLIDVTAPDQPWNLATFQDQARQAIHAIHGRRRLPFLVGGTGQYVRAVVQDWQLPRVEPDPDMRKTLEDWTSITGKTGLHDRLAVLDPRAAAVIDPHNLRRTIRALEVIFHTGRRFSDQRQHGALQYQVLMIGMTLPREVLYERIDRRIDAMLEAGLVDEIRGLLSQGYSAELPIFSSIGYREIIAFLQGRINWEEAVAEIRRATRILVRRQANWFKPQDAGIRWFDLSFSDLTDIETTIWEWLKSIFDPNI